MVMVMARVRISRVMGAQRSEGAPAASAASRRQGSACEARGRQGTCLGVGVGIKLGLGLGLRLGSGSE